MDPLTEYGEEQNLHPFYLYITKMRGGNRPAFQKVDHKHHVLTAIGSFIGIGMVAFLSSFYHIPLLVSSSGQQRSWWTIALGVTLAIFFMSLTHTLHPPGGATAFVAVYTGQSFAFILSPVGLDAFLLVIIALIVNNISTRRKYPDFWF